MPARYPAFEPYVAYAGCSHSHCRSEVRQHVSLERISKVNIMGAFFETIPPSLIEWIRQQKVFWVATAPLSGAGHVNVSPKGGEYFGVIDEKTFWYMDLTGSGNETISHLLEPGNGRITIQLNAFEGPPKIVRLFGHGIYTCM